MDDLVKIIVNYQFDTTTEIVAPLLENQNFLFNSVSENFVPSEQDFSTSHITHNSKSENVL